jgi:hypothetical protein
MASLSAETVRYLQKNPVKGSDQIKFQDEGHKYWARSKYYDDWVSNSDGLGGLPLISATTVLDKYFHFDRYGIALKIWNNPEKRHAMKYDMTSPYYGCESVHDIITKWSKGAEEGTKLHAHYEDMANILEYDKDNKPEEGVKLMRHLYDEERLVGFTEKSYFYEFVKQFGLDDPESGMRFYRTELLLWHDILHLSGTIDGLLYNEKDDSYVIIDWKRCKGGVKGDPVNPKKPVHLLAPGGRGFGLPAFECLRNNSMNRYGCQLTLYKNMFEHMTGKRISGLYLVAIDSKLIGKKNALKIHHVPLTKYDECIRQAFEERAREMLGNCSDNLSDEHMDKLIDIIEDGERIRQRAIEVASKREREEDDETESDESEPEAKKSKK